MGYVRDTGEPSHRRNCIAAVLADLDQRAFAAASRRAAGRVRLSPGRARPDCAAGGAWSRARAEAISIRTLATAIGLSPSRVHQIVAAADPDALDAALGELRAAGWPAPEHSDSGEDTELGSGPVLLAWWPAGRGRAGRAAR
jgi:hypothetical protein